ncbi:NAD(+) diphosphatase [Idiomarina xiamenensis]|uniref:NAD(+) diphosphatase n=1 Tax=Idiomarina xiamenensis 10-D-4 TaxID=740709 RepID=K2L3V6_9GAMM|nr:NAD(+) diphosphatase [Idiomarina xiamenensis]EKE84530.1 NUDIX family pyrophosphohydrolase [Idiomarina xiamenensis 10-D-4]
MVKPNVRPAADEPCWWFIVVAGEVIVTDASPRVPFGCQADLPLPDLQDYTVLQLGELRERPCYLVMADYGDQQFSGLGEFQSLRVLLFEDEALFAMAGRASQVAEFLLTHRYCGRCGSRMETIEWELATQCSRCSHRCYPRISPCIIVAIRRGRQLLLARGKRHKAGLYSILAGFVETGESLEQALHREVMEEAGIEVNQLQYHFSQPWPFPHSLMMGYTAVWQAGQLRLDPLELEQGDWFDIDQLPQTPPAGTIAHRLIELSKALITAES